MSSRRWDVVRAALLVAAGGLLYGARRVAATLDPEGFYVVPPVVLPATGVVVAAGLLALALAVPNEQFSTRLRRLFGLGGALLLAAPPAVTLAALGSVWAYHALGYTASRAFGALAALLGIGLPVVGVGIVVGSVLARGYRAVRGGG